MPRPSSFFPRPKRQKPNPPPPESDDSLTALLKRACLQQCSVTDMQTIVASITGCPELQLNSASFLLRAAGAKTSTERLACLFVIQHLFSRFTDFRTTIAESLQQLLPLCTVFRGDPLPPPLEDARRLHKEFCLLLHQWEISHRHSLPTLTYHLDVLRVHASDASSIITRDASERRQRLALGESQRATLPALLQNCSSALAQLDGAFEGLLAAHLETAPLRLAHTNIFTGIQAPTIVNIALSSGRITLKPAAAELVTVGAAAAAAMRSCASKLSHAERAIVRAPFEGAIARSAEADVQQCTNMRIQLQKRAQDWDAMKERIVISCHIDEEPLHDAEAVRRGAASVAMEFETGNRLSAPCSAANRRHGIDANADVEARNNDDSNVSGTSDEDDESNYDCVVFEHVL